MIFLSIGHYPGAKGASYNGIYEFDLATQWANMIFDLAPNKIKLVPVGTLKQLCQPLL